MDNTNYIKEKLDKIDKEMDYLIDERQKLRKMLADEEAPKPVSKEMIDDLKNRLPASYQQSYQQLANDIKNADLQPIVKRLRVDTQEGVIQDTDSLQGYKPEQLRVPGRDMDFRYHQETKPGIEHAKTDEELKEEYEMSQALKLAQQPPQQNVHQHYPVPPPQSQNPDFQEYRQPPQYRPQQVQAPQQYQYPPPQPPPQYQQARLPPQKQPPYAYSGDNYPPVPVPGKFPKGNMANLVFWAAAIAIACFLIYQTFIKP